MSSPAQLMAAGSSIRVENLYYLLSYAWGLLPVETPESRGTETPPATLLQLLVMLLRDRLEQLVKRGLDQDYRTEQTLTAVPRGKLLLGRSMRELTLPRAKVWCETDHRTVDTLLNQLVKAAARRLAEEATVSEAVRGDLGWLLRWFSEVQDVPLLNSRLGTVRVYRHTARYGMAVHISQLVRKLALPTQEGGTVLVPDVWRDERRMARLFEQFVRNFYAFHLRGLASVRANGLKWNLVAEDNNAAKHIPNMQTDVVVEYNDRKRVALIECKFYPQALGAEHYGKRKVRSAHLYQLFAYQQHLKQQFPGRELRSVLLYPVGDESMLLRYQMEKEPVRVYTLNLNQSWQMIHGDMLALLNNI
jgi:5-methylcytosine-specific restriction enzyme subunit McrC